MESGSHTTSPLGHRTHILANVIGAAIALVTLALPIIVIAHYTPESPPTVPSPTHAK